MLFHLPQRAYPEKGPAVPGFPRVCFDFSAHDVFTSATTLFLPVSAKENIPTQYVRGVCCGRTLRTASCYPVSGIHQGHGIIEWVPRHCLGPSHYPHPLLLLRQLSEPISHAGGLRHCTVRNQLDWNLYIFEKLAKLVCIIHGAASLWIPCIISLKNVCPYIHILTLWSNQLCYFLNSWKEKLSPIHRLWNSS